MVLFLTDCWEEKGFHTFPNGICPKVNVLVLDRTVKKILKNNYINNLNMKVQLT